MSDSARADYLATVGTDRAPVVVELDRVVTAAHPGFDVGIYYRQLTYALDGDFRRWVCAIDANPKPGVALRFLYGILLDDPRGVFRGAKSSPLRTINMPSLDAIDPQLITEYVGRAVSAFDEYKALPDRWYAKD
jgi:hypothetical protein